MDTATRDTLDRLVEFDHPFTIGAGGTFGDGPEGLYAPEVYHVEGEREPEVIGEGWAFVDGYSGQHGYSGPVMHASEFLGGGMAADVLSTPGVYVVCAVEDLDDPDNPAGWVLLRREDERPDPLPRGVIEAERPDDDRDPIEREGGILATDDHLRARVRPHGPRAGPVRGDDRARVV